MHIFSSEPAPFFARYLRIIFFLSIVIFAPIFIGLEYVGWRLGATVPLSTIAREQQENHKLLWLGNFKDYAFYKLQRIKLIQPELLLVGSSRCGQARARVFRPYRAYNACLTAWPLDHVVDFIERATRESKPRVVIVALDYFLFGDELTYAWRKERKMDYEQGMESQSRKLHDVFEFARRNGWNTGVIKAAIAQDAFEPIDNNRLIGTEAIRGQFGFRDDGSMFVFSGYRRIAPEELARGAQYVTASFPGAAHLSERQFAPIIRLSNLAKERGFTVVGIQFPFLKSATDFLDTNQAYWPIAGHWRELRSDATAKRFTELGIRFFDMSRDPASADPFNFFDPAHPSERGVLKTIISLLDHKDFRDIFPLLEKNALEADLSLSPGQQFDLYH